MSVSGHPVINPVQKPGEWRCLRRGGREENRIVTRQISGKREKETEKGNFLLCGNCGHIITSSLHKVERNGKYCHTFTNPSGYVFRIGCFSRAVGAVNQGDPSAEYSWFSGYSWRYTLCLKCFNHLGWCFQGGEEYFLGLILDRLIETGLS